MPKPKKPQHEAPPVPSKVEVVDLNPVLSVIQTTYTGENAKKARAQDERRKRWNERLESFLERGLAERNRVLLEACRWQPEGLGPFKLSNDWDPKIPEDREVIETVSRWLALPGAEAFNTGFDVGYRVGQVETEQAARARDGFSNEGRTERKAPLAPLIDGLKKLGVLFSSADGILKFFGEFEGAQKRRLHPKTTENKLKFSEKRTTGFDDQSQRVVATCPEPCDSGDGVDLDREIILRVYGANAGLSRKVHLLALAVNDTKKRIEYRLEGDPPGVMRTLGRQRLRAYASKQE